MYTWLNLKRHINSVRYGFLLCICWLLANIQTGKACNGGTPYLSFSNSFCEGVSFLAYDSSSNNSSTGMLSYKIDFGDGSDSSGNGTFSAGIPHTYNTKGNYKIRYIRYFSNCTDSVDISITVNALPQPDFSFSTTTYCSGSTFKFTDNSTGVKSGSYLWDFGDSLSGAYNYSNVKNPTHVFYSDTDRSFTVKLTITNSTGCSNVYSKAVTISALPPDSFYFSPDSACSGTTVGFKAIGKCAGCSYSWNFGDVGSSSNISTGDTTTHVYKNDVGTGYATHTVTLKVTNANGCIDSMSRIIYVSQKPNPQLIDSNASHNPAFTNCGTGGGSGNFDLTVKNATSGTASISSMSIDWGDGQSTNVSPTFSYARHTYTSIGSFNMVITAKNKNGCSASTKYYVGNQSSPDVGLTLVGGNSGCAPYTVAFKITNYGNNSPGTEYVWNFGDSSGLVTWTYGQPSINDTIYHTYTRSSCTMPGKQFSVDVTAQNTCDTLTKTYSGVKIYDPPHPDFDVPDSVCLNAQVTITNTTIEGYNSTCNQSTSYTWSFQNGSTTTYSGQNPPKIKWTSTGVYDIKLVAGNSTCGSDSITKTITVYDVPAASFTTNVDSGCTNLDVVCTNGSTGYGLSYLWSITPNTGYTYVTGDSSSANPKIRFTAPQDYWLQLITRNGCDADTVGKQIRVKSRPAIQLDTIYRGCITYTINPTAYFDPSNGTITKYQWRFPGGSPSSSTAANPGTVTYSSAGTYTVTAIATNECGTDSAQRTFKVSKLPTVNAGADDSICGGAGTLKMKSFSPTGGKWSGTGVDSTGLFDPLVSGPGYFTLTYTYTDTSTGCTSFDTKQIQVTEKPSPDFSYSGGCSNLKIKFTDNTTIGTGTINSWNWNFGDGATSTSQNPTHTYTTSGNYKVLLKVTSTTGCYDTLSRFIKISTSPSCKFGTTKACYGTATAFFDSTTANAGNIVNWFWDFGDGDTLTAYNPTHLFDSVTTYSVKLVTTSEFGCKDSVTQSVKVGSAPVAKFTTLNQCYGNTSYFYDSSTVSGGSISKRKWYFGDGKSSTQKNPTYAYVPGKYTVSLSVTTSDGCTDSTSRPITIYALPVPAFDFGSNDLCAPYSAQVSNTTFSSTNVVSWKWKILNGATQVDYDTAFEPTFTFPDNKGTKDTAYFIRLVAVTADGCSDSFQTSFIVRARPQANFTLPDSACSPYSYTPTNSSSVKATAYKWLITGPQTATISDDTATAPVLYFPNNTSDTCQTYQVYLLAMNKYGCTDTMVKSIVLKPMPLTYFNMDKDTGCTPLTIKFTNTSDPNYLNQVTSDMTYFWDFGNGVTSKALDTTVQFINPAVYDSTFIIHLTGYRSDGCSWDTTRLIRVYPSPKASMNYKTAGGCAPLTIDSTIVSLNDYSQANSSYAWYVNDTFYTTNTTFPGRTITSYGDSIKISLIAYARHACTRTSDTQTVWFKAYPPPFVAFTPSDTIGCTPLSINFKNTTTPNSGVTYQWNFGNGNTATTKSPSGISFTNSGVNDTTFTVWMIATDTTNGCKDSLSKVITVYPKAKATFSFNDTLECAPFKIDTSNIKVTKYPNAVKGFKWYANGTQIGTGSTFPGYTITTANDSVRITLLAVAFHGCSNDSQVQYFHTRPNPFVAFTPSDTVGCHPFKVTFTNNSTPTSGVSYQWDFGNGQTSTSKSPSGISFTNTGTLDSSYTVKLVVTNTGTGCKDSTTKTITVKPLPDVAFTTSSDTACYPFTITANNTTGSNPSNSTYQWSITGSATIDSPSTSRQIIITFPDNQTGSFKSYTLKLKVTSSFGCIDSITKTLYQPSRPVAAFALSPDSSCGAGTSTTANTSNYASSYVWSSPYSGISFSSTTASTPTISFPENTGSADSSYAISLVAISTYGCRDSVTHKLLIHPSPKASFTLSDTQACGLLKPKITNTSTGNTKLTYQWDFGDGTTDTATNPTHSFSTPGDYVITLIASTKYGCKDTSSQTVHVYATPVTAFSVNDSTQCFNSQSFQFTNQSTLSIGSMTYQWDFGDGSSDTATNPTHTYSASGTYTVTLIATSGISCSDTAKHTMTVYPAPVMDFSIDDSSQCFNKNKVAFTNNTTISSGTLTWHWDFGDGTTSSSKNPTHSYGAHGNYTVWLTATSAKGCIDSISHNLTIYPEPQAAFTINDTTQCVNTNVVSFTNTSSVAYGTLTSSWDFGDGSSDTATNPNHTYAASGTYTIWLKVTAPNGCVDSVKHKVLIYPQPNAEFIISDSLQCLKLNAVSFKNKSTISSGYMTWAWDFGDGATDTVKSPSHTYTSDGIFTVTLMATSGFGCVDTAVSQVIIYPDPQASFTTNDTNQCVNGNDFQFTNTSSIGYGNLSASWNFGDGNSDTTWHAAHTYTAYGTYKVRLIVTGPNACADTMDQYVVADPKPVVNFTVNDSDQCFNQHAFVFTNGSKVAAGTMTYFWDFGDGNTSTQTSPTYSYASYGNYTVKLITTSDMGCADSASHQVLVRPSPIPSFSVSNSQQCINEQSLQLVDNSSIPTGTYTRKWHFGDGATDTVANPTHSYAAVGTYTVKLVLTSDQGCMDSLSQTITVNPKPTPLFSVNDTSQCFESQSFVFTNKSSIANGSALSYFWDFGDGNTSTQASPTYQYASYGHYTVKMVVTSAEGCRDSSTADIVVFPQPAAAFTVNQTDQCINANFYQFTNTSTAPWTGMTYSWNFGDGNTSTATSPSWQYSQVGVYQVVLIATSSFGCSDTFTIQVEVHDKPHARFSVNDTDNCVLLDAKFTDQTPGATSWLWNFDDPTSAFNVDTVANPGHVYLQTGTFTPTLIVANQFGCFDTLSHTVHVYPDPIAGFDLNPKAGCDTPLQVDFTNLSSGAVAYLWDFGNGKTSTLTSPFTFYNYTGTYAIILTAFTNNGCADSMVYTYPIAPTPVANFTPDSKTTCEGEPTVFTNLSAYALSYIWDFGDGITSTDKDPVHVYTKPGTYDVVLTAINMNCVDTQLKQQIVFPKPTAGFSYLNDNNPIQMGKIVFQSVDTTARSYHWDFGDGDTSDVRDPMHRYMLFGDFNVTQMVESYDGCWDTITQTVHVDLMTGLFVPNAFSPESGTGDARLFKPHGVGLKRYSCQVFNAMGELVWQSTSLSSSMPAEGWDGTYKGRPCQEDVYVWKVEAEFIDGTTWRGMPQSDGKYAQVGTVTLLR